MNAISPQAWEQFIDDHPQAHILQTPSWGELKSAYGWSTRFVCHGNVGAMVLLRHLPLGMRIAYIPRGPVGEGDWNHLWPSIDNLCRGENAIFLRVEPDIWEPVEGEFIASQLPGFVASEQTIQPPRTVVVDLEPSEEDILLAMKSKTRYNIHLAERKDVAVRSSNDAETFHHMMTKTGIRDEFGIHSLAYYQRAYKIFSRDKACLLLFAEYQNQPLAGLMAFSHGDTAWYFYGASTNQERNRMPTYLLQWEAMRWAKKRGCKHYDLWGIPDFPEEVLEGQFANRSDGLWGVYRFKRGFGGEVRRTIGTWDRIYKLGLYQLYKLWSKYRPTSSS